MKYVENLHLFQKFKLEKSREEHPDLLREITKLEQDIDSEEKFQKQPSGRVLKKRYSPVNLLHIFRTPFLKNTSGLLLLKFEEYDKTRSDGEKIYDKIAERVKVRSKSSCYQYGEKPTKFFYGLEKKNAINLTLESFNENLFQKEIKKSVSDIKFFLGQI